MKIGILETGRPPGQLSEQFGDYAAMVGAMLGDGFTLESFDVQDGQATAASVGARCFFDHRLTRWSL